MTFLYQFKNSTKLIIATTLTTLIFIFSYFSFVSFRPKALKEYREVKGFTDVRSNLLAPVIPPYAKNLGTDQSVKSQKITFETDKNPADVKLFYNNILEAEGWVLKKENLTASAYSAEYRKEKLEMNIWSSFDLVKKLTLGGIEISKN